MGTGAGLRIYNLYKYKNIKRRISPRRLRGAPAGAQLAVYCRRPARLRSTTPRLCGSCAAALVSHDDGRLPRCQRVGSYARCHHLRPRAPGSILGTNSRATQRAGELAAADPAYRARFARRLQLAARLRRPEKLPRGAPFGVELERAIAHGGLRSARPRGRPVRRMVRRLCDAQR